MNRREKLTLGVAAAAVALPLMTIPQMALADDSTVTITQTQVTPDGTAQKTLSEGLTSLATSNGTVTVTKVEKTGESQSTETNKEATEQASQKTTEDETTQQGEQADEEGKRAGGTDQQHVDSQEGQRDEEETTDTSKAASPLRRMAQAKVIQKTTTEQVSVTVNQVVVASQTTSTGQSTTQDTASQGNQTSTVRHTLMRAAVTTTAATKALASGLYEIAAGTNGALRLDVRGSSASNGGAVQTWGDNATAAQRWRVTSVGGGWYTLQNVASGKYLDVPFSNARSGAKLQQWAGNGTNAQRWAIVADPKRPGMWTIRTRLDSGLVVDVPSSSASQGRQLQLYKANGTVAQSFAFSRVTQAIADGVYAISNVGSGKRLDVSYSSLDDEGNVQQYSANGTMAQSFRVRYNSSTGYYTIVNAQSGKVLDVRSSISADGTNVQQYTSNGTRAQQWAIESVGSGAWRIRSAIDGRVLDVTFSSHASGANVQTYHWNGTNAQRWTFTKLPGWLPAGTYEVLSALNHANALGVPDGTYSAANVTTTGSASLDPFRKWQFTGNGDGTWRIVNVGSGLALTMAGSADGAPLRQQAWTGAPGQRWALSVEVGGILLRSALSPKVADVSASSTRAGARVQAYTSNGTYAQRFIARATSLFEANQSYVIHAKSDTDRVLDVSFSSTADGATVQFYRSNGTMAQLYYVEDAGGGRVRIVNANSGKYLVPAPGKAGVTQSSARHSTASLWTMAWDGAANGLRITSVSTGRALEYGQATGSASTSAKLASPSAGSSKQSMLLSAYVVSYSGNRMNGIDVSHWQEGINLTAVPSDFVIVKATQGISYTDPGYIQRANQTLSLGKQLGFYHFVSTKYSASDQARHFVNAIKDYVGRAILILDWEDNDQSGEKNVSKGTAYAKQFLDAVHALTGVKPLIYMNRSTAASYQYDWSAVSGSGYQLWVAQYLNEYYQGNGVSGYVSDPRRARGTYGSWSAPVMYQYTSKGHLSGYSGELDLNVFYGDVNTWKFLASKR